MIFFVSAQPTVPSLPGRWDLLLKKAMHVLAYAILTWLYLRALRGHNPRGTRFDVRWIRIVGAAMALLYALSDEYHQTFVPGRNGSLIDVAIDGVGVAGVILLDWRIQLKRRPAGETASG